MHTGKIVGSAPILLVKDVVKSAEYWRDCVGFNIGSMWGDPPAFSILNRDKYHLMLSKAPSGHTIVPHWKVVDKMWNVYFWVDDVEAVYKEIQERGAKIDYTLCTQPYGVKEFGIQDLDDHDIAFGQVID